jgi:hypothetical protein
MKKSIYSLVILALAMPAISQAVVIAPRTTVTTQVKLATTTAPAVNSATVVTPTRGTTVTSPEPSVPGTIIGINPQPEPPKEIQIDPINQLNPQPEPPMPANARSATQLNPQPEPPIPSASVSGLLNAQTVAGATAIKSLAGFDYKQENNGTTKVFKFQPTDSQTPLSLDVNNFKFNLVGNKIEIGTSTLDFTESANKTPIIEIKLRNSSSSAPDMVKVKMVNNNAIMNFPQGDGEGQVTLKSDFEVQNGKIILLDGTNKLTISQNPNSFMTGLGRMLQSKKANMKGAELGIENGKPVYDVKAEVEGKFLGLINMPLSADLKVGADNNTVQAVKFPWYGFLYTKPDFKVNLVADFAVTSVVIPDSYKKGNTITAKVTITNVGTATGVTEYNVGTGACTAVVYYWGEFKDNWSCLLTALQPGESYTYEWNLKGDCAPLKVDFDPGKTVKDDPDFGNNILSASSNCSQ